MVKVWLDPTGSMAPHVVLKNKVLLFLQNSVRLPGVLVNSTNTEVVSTSKVDYLISNNIGKTQKMFLL